VHFRLGDQPFRGDFFYGREQIFSTHTGINQDGNNAYFKKSKDQRGELQGGADKQKRFAAASKSDFRKPVGVLVGKRFQIAKRDGVVAIFFTQATGIFHRDLVFMDFCYFGKTISDIHGWQLLTVIYINFFISVMISSPASSST